MPENNANIPPLWPWLTPRCRRILLDGFKLAAAAGAERVEPDHLLTALCADAKSTAYFMLQHAGISPESLCPPHAAPPVDQPKTLPDQFSDATLAVLRGAAAAAGVTGTRHICTEHLLMGLPADPIVGSVLSQRGFSRSAALRGVAAWRRKSFITQRVGLGLEPQNRLRLKLTPTGLLTRFFSALALPAKVYIGKSLLHPRFRRNPYPLYDQLRRQTALRQDPVLPVWTAYRFADAQALLKDPRFARAPFTMDAFPRAALEQLKAPEEPDRLFAMMLFSDPPRHTRLRTAFMRAMGAVSLAALRPAMEAQSLNLLGQAKKRGRLDIVADFAVPFPVFVITALFGLPPEDMPRLKSWSDQMTPAIEINPTARQLDLADAAYEEFRLYLENKLHTISTHPDAHLLSALITRGGADISPAQFVANCMLLLMAGHETTTSLIANGVWLLHTHPEALADLRADPGKMPAAVEEILRFESPVQWTGRMAAEDIDWQGRTIRRGELILFSLGAANRDPAQFDHPNKFDIHRTDNRHLAFGMGIHFCLGAMLARMEAQVALEVLLRTFPRARLKQPFVRWRKGLVLRCPLRLAMDMA